MRLRLTPAPFIVDREPSLVSALSIYISSSLHRPMLYPGINYPLTEPQSSTG